LEVEIPVETPKPALFKQIDLSHNTKLKKMNQQNIIISSHITEESFEEEKQRDNNFENIHSEILSYTEPDQERYTIHKVERYTGKNSPPEKRNPSELLSKNRKLHRKKIQRL